MGGRTSAENGGEVKLLPLLGSADLVCIVEDYVGTWIQATAQLKTSAGFGEVDEIGVADGMLFVRAGQHIHSLEGACTTTAALTSFRVHGVQPWAVTCTPRGAHIVHEGGLVHLHLRPKIASWRAVQCWAPRWDVAVSTHDVATLILPGTALTALIAGDSEATTVYFALAIEAAAGHHRVIKLEREAAPATWFQRTSGQLPGPVVSLAVHKGCCYMLVRATRAATLAWRDEALYDEEPCAPHTYTLVVGSETERHVGIECVSVVTTPKLVIDSDHGLALVACDRELQILSLFSVGGLLQTLVLPALVSGLTMHQGSLYAISHADRRHVFHWRLRHYPPIPGCGQRRTCAPRLVPPPLPESICTIS